MRVNSNVSPLVPRMWRPSSPTLFFAALVVVVSASVVLAHYAFTPSAVTSRRPDITPPVLLVPSGLALLVLQAARYRLLGDRLAAGVFFLFGGVVVTLVVTFVVGCGF